LLGACSPYFEERRRAWFRDDWQSLLMPYQAEISRSSPTAILVVIDQSTSMNQRLQSGQTKANFLADALNKTLYTIITNCSKADGVRDYFYIGVVAYSGISARNGFHGALASEPLHPVSRIADTPLRIESRVKIGATERRVETLSPSSAARLF
jgi:hypothetical protein